MSNTNDDTRPLLISSGNPNGWNLDDLCKQIKNELIKLSSEDTTLARVRVNEDIIHMMEICAELHSSLSQQDASEQTDA